MSSLQTGHIIALRRHQRQRNSVDAPLDHVKVSVGHALDDVYIYIVYALYHLAHVD